MLWDAGLVVVVSAGNYGPKDGTIAIPGSSRKGDYSRVTGGSQIVNVHSQKNGIIRGRGPTKQCVVKPDLTAPGDKSNKL